ncbi:hypothetical protein ACTFR8_23690 [Bacillus cereus group sp. MYBK15-3]|uniref:hypothetical protein n=1 Tax=unclassified Bacillus cereus group TaxID=2750818 RepID=UPI003F7B045A
MRKIYNENPPKDGVKWIVRNLKICFSRDGIIEACNKNIEHWLDNGVSEDDRGVQFMRNLINEMYVNSHAMMFTYYSEKLEEYENAEITSK